MLFPCPVWLMKQLVFGAELPEVEVGEGLEAAQAGGQRTHSIVVKAQCLQRDELTELLRQLTQTVLRQI